MAEEVFIFPCSFAQQRIWFLDQFEPGSAYYNIPLAVRLQGRVNVPLLEQSLNEVVRRHETLRTRFKMIDGQPMQVIVPSLAIEMRVRELRGMPVDRRKEEAMRLATAEARQPFDLTVAPLLRALLMRLGDDDYLLTVTIHHIVGDGWSIGILIREITSLYEAFKTGTPSPLADLPIQYADFADWEQQWLQGELLNEQLSYWEQKLAGELPVLELPTDHPRPLVPGHRGAHFYFKLPLDLTEQLKMIARSEEATLFMTLLAALKVMLYRYTGHEDVPVGVPNANRNQIETEGLIGFFVNTLVMRTDLSGEPSFRQLLRRVRETVLEADAHREVPFEKLVERLQPERNLAQNPLFQVMFQFQNDRMAPLALPDLTLSFLELETATAKFDLILSMRETPEGLSGAAQYDTELFEPETVERMMGHYHNLLVEVAANPEQLVSRVPLLSPPEKQQLEEWNQTRGDQAPRQCLHDLFASQAERTPEALAVISGAQSWTYRELNTRANQIANHLRRLGVGPDVRVGLCLEPSFEMTAGVLGVLKAGGAYVPLDPAYPRERIRLMLGDAAARAVLTQSWLTERLPDGLESVECLDKGWKAPGAEIEVSEAKAVSPENLAYVIYTSGSTGIPKGVAMTHEAIVNLMWWQIREPGFSTGARTAQIHSFSFDVSCQEMFSTWASGGTLVLFTEEERRDAGKLLEGLSQLAVERLFLPPVALQQLAEASLDQTPPQSLSQIIVAGEQLQVGDVTARLFARLKNCILHNQYGPTESHVVTAFSLPASAADWPNTPPIGRPVANTQIRLLDKWLQPVPVGVPGHLYIGGVALARGYLGRPQLTAERFIPDPWSTKPGARLYMTGDLARYLADGNIEFLGRIDNQVKIRGFRIEPAEVEAVLKRNPAVQDAVVVVRELSPGDKRLVAYLVSDNDSAPSTPELHRFLREILPKYMIPSVFMHLDALPLTPSGKVDRRALPAPDARAKAERGEERELTAIEEMVAGAWCEVLGVSRVGAEQDFFELGGHSLLATRVVSRLRDIFNVELPVRRMFETPTVAGLATSIELANGNGQMLQMPPIKRAKRVSEIPLSFSQQRLWFLDQLEPGSPFYNLSTAVRIQGPLNVEALERAFNEVVRRHESLRTTFASANGRAIQIVSPERKQHLSVTDLSGMPEVEREAESQRLAKEESQLPFDLATGPLLRVRLLRLGMDRHVALLTMHHIISDGWSKGVLIKELAELYEAYSANLPSPLMDLPIQYADFSYSQREWLQGEVLERHLSYWQEQLAGAPAVLELPTDLPRPAIQTFRGLTHNFDLPADLSDELKNLSRREGATLFMTLMSAFSMLLSRYTGQEDLIVGTAIANRDHSATEDLIGMFVNTLPMRVEMSGSLGFDDLLRRVRETALGAYTHQALPFERLIDELQLKRDTSRSPLVQVMLILQNVPVNTVELPGLRLTSVVGESRVAKLDLILSITEDAGALRCALEYNTDLFKAATITRLAGHFRTILEGVVADWHRPLWEYPMLTATEYGQLAEWNATGAHDKQNYCIHELFEAQAERTPDMMVVSCEENSLTYAELNRRANQLARHLHDLGVGSEVRVGICIERCLEMVVGLLGILKAGGAYVPMDVEYPRERVSFMLTDARVGVLLTKEALLPSLPSNQAHTLCLDADWDVISQHSDENLSSQVKPENLAYVIYTSGSTGRPKGVMVSHRNVAHLFAAIYPGLGLNEREVWTLCHSYAFDFSVWEIWGALLHGGELVIVPLWTTRSPESFYELIKSRQVTVLSQTPSAFGQWSGAGTGTARGDDELAVRLIILGGEALPAEMSHELMKREHPVWNFYGPTEATVWALIHRLDSRREVPHSIGYPIPNMQSHILDRHGMAVPVGVAGELHLGGEGLSRGYFHQPGLTAEKFVPHPSSKDAGERLYRTGDLARYLPDGRIEYLGRIDEQVKLRGYRIEPGEIEAALCEQSPVRDAVVVARRDSLGQRLVAYLVGEPGKPLVIDQMRDALRDKLPEYMIPAAFVILEELPLSPNGKIDRRALPAPTAERTGEDPFTPAETAEELALATAWTGVLGVEQISVHDNFFDLGGDSIRCIQVRAETQKQGYDFSIQELFRYQTIFNLSRHLRTFEVSTGMEMSPPPFSFVNETDRERLPEWVEDAYPLARLQQGMLFHSELSRGMSVYHDIVSFHLRAPFAPEALTESLRELVARHPVLRTSFDLASFEEPLQLVFRSVDLPLSIVDLRDFLPEEQEERLADWIEAEKRNPFDWTKPPFVRFAVFRRSETTFQFALSYHHAILDGWSLASLLTELFTIYSTRLPGVEIRQSLPPLRALYRDFIALERQAIESGESRNYWYEKLADCVATTWPERDPLAEGVGDTRFAETQFPPEYVEKLREFARRTGVSLKSVLLGAHLRVLSLLSGRREVLTGLVSNGRPETTDGERVLGLFLNTVPLSVSLSGGTWIDLVQSAHKAEEEMFPFRRYPLAELQRRHDNWSLIEITFNFTHFHAVDALRDFSNLEVLDAQAYSRTNFPVGVSFTLDPSSSRLTLHLECHEEKDEEQLWAAADYFRRVLDAMMADPMERYETFSPLSENELRQLQVEWNDTRVEYPRTRCLHEMFESQVERTPGATAVIFGEEQLSYRELDERANQLAHHLRALGVGPEVPVGILMERSLELAVALLAVLKAGGAYVPLDPAYPVSRLSFMIKDSRSPVVLTQERMGKSLQPVLSDFDGAVVAVDSRWPAIAEESRERPPRSATSENLVYVIYTSGSTGQPKGAMLDHRGIVNCVLWMQGTYQLEESDSFLFKTSLNFDPSVWEFFWPLSVGARVVIARPGEQADTAYLLETIARHEITSIYFVPSMLRLFLDDPRAGAATSLRRVICGGEKLPTETIALFFDTLRAELHHSYGPTETSIAASEWHCDREQPRRVVSIGRPLANTEIHLLDTHMQPVPAGVAGNLHIGGDCLGRGYLYRPDLTAENFVPHPFSDEPGRRLYCTGDLARYLRNGEIEFLGRVDQQVKVRGYRIEPGEIEAVLRRNPLVSDCLVLMRGKATDERQLIAYVVAAPERNDGEPAGKSGVDAGELRRHLRDQLPVHMIPSTFVIMDALPLMPNGKVDRRALPEPKAGVESAAVYVAPGTMAEEIVASLWQELLKVERVGVRDDFFELGGHSLLATQLISRVRATLQADVALRELFEHPTLGEFALRVEDAGRAAAGVEMPTIQRVQRDGKLLLSFAQQRLWFLDQLQPGALLFNSSGNLRLSGELNHAVLEATLTEIVRRHETLRTTFTSVEGQPVQVIQPPQPVQMPIIDLTEFAENEREAEARRIAVECSHRPFDLSQGPLFRLTVFRLSVQDYLLLYTMHHIISDGWSVGVLIREVATLYPAILNNEPSPLADLPVQYADFASWQRAWLDREVLEKQLDYWKRQLSGAPSVLELPLDHPRPPVQSQRGAHLPVEIPAPLTAALNKLSKREGVTLFMTLLSAWQTLLMRYSGQQDILVGTTIANRNHHETEPLIGFFANTLVLRTDLSGDPSFRELLVRVKEVALEAYAHQDLPFEKLVEELEPVRTLSHAPLFQVMFGLENVPREALQLPNLQLTQTEWIEDTVKADLTLGMQERNDIIDGVLGFNTDIFEPATMARLAGHFLTLLASMVADPEQRLSELSLLPDAERYYLTETVNVTTESFPLTSAAHQLFAQQAERSPNATALSFGSIDFSYAELNEKSNQLAHRLLKLGVGREKIVAVCLERSPESVISLLAIWKAGAAYLPLDVEQPVQRLRLMLADAAPSLVITTRELRRRLELDDDAETKVLCPENEEELLDRQPRSNPDGEVDLSDLAYVIYTSGSTGTPKGVLVEHRQLLNTLLAAQKQYRFTPQDVVPFFFTFAFDISLFELLTPLLAGARVLLLSAREMLEEQRAAAVLKQVTFLHSSPGLMRQMVALMSAAPAGSHQQVRAVMIGGDAVLPELLNELRAVLPQTRLYVGYGPTEATIMCASYDLGDASEKLEVEHRMLGYPMANSALRLYDSGRQLVPLGVPGEVYIGGASVSRGYLNRPDLTAERFVERDGRRWYRSGDLGRRLPDGSIAFAGRVDRQVKLRGYRIELGEIEMALTQHPQVYDSVVTLREDVPGDQRLLAYLVPRRNHLSKTTHSLYQLPNGIEIAHLNENETDNLYEEIFGQEIYLRYDITLRDGDCIFDVDANIGMFTLFVNDMCRDSVVYAFEPVSTTFAALEYNVAAYNLNARTYNCSLTSQNGNANVDFRAMVAASSGIYDAAVTGEKVQHAYLDNQGTQAADFTAELEDRRFPTPSVGRPFKTLSDVISENQIERIDLLKLDVEKSGLNVLRGIGPDDWPKIKQVVSAVHDIEGGLEQFKGLLKTHGFEVMVDQDYSFEHPGRYYLYAIHPSRYESGTAERNHRAGSYLSEHNLSVGGLQSYLKERLPEYMIPAAFVTLDALPTLPTGKIDRNALPAPDPSRPELEDAYLAPRNSVEARIAEVWIELLGVERVGVHDNFFELGGHSLLATTAITRLQEQFHVEISLRRFFENPTLAGVALSVVEGLAAPFDDDQMSEILGQLEDLPAEARS